MTSTATALRMYNFVISAEIAQQFVRMLMTCIYSPASQCASFRWDWNRKLKLLLNHGFAIIVVNVQSSAREKPIPEKQ